MASEHQQKVIHDYIRRNLRTKVDSPYGDGLSVTPISCNRTGWKFRHPDMGVVEMKWESMSAEELSNVWAPPE